MRTLSLLKRIVISLAFFAYPHLLTPANKPVLHLPPGSNTGTNQPVHFERAYRALKGLMHSQGNDQGLIRIAECSAYSALRQHPFAHAQAAFALRLLKAMIKRNFQRALNPAITILNHILSLNDETLIRETGVIKFVYRGAFASQAAQKAPHLLLSLLNMPHFHPAAHRLATIGSIRLFLFEHLLTDHQTTPDERAPIYRIVFDALKLHIAHRFYRLEEDAINLLVLLGHSPHTNSAFSSELRGFARVQLLRLQVQWVRTEASAAEATVRTDISISVEALEKLLSRDSPLHLFN